MMCTLKDVAARCGMDLSTVSRALRDDPRVKSETVEKIKKIASSMGYKPNLAARSLAAGRTGTVWFILGSLDNPIEKLPAVSAGKKLAALDYDLLIAPHHGDRKIYKRLLDRLRQGVADGAVIIPSFEKSNEFFPALKKAGVPFVFLDRYLSEINAPVIGTDNRSCVKSLIDKALLEGVSSFVVIGAEHNPVARARRDSALEILKEKGLDFTYLDETLISENPDALALEGDLCIMATGQATVLSFLHDNKELVKPDRRIFFAVFDAWIGEPNPAEKVFVCYQDFEKMAEKSVAVLLDIINGGRDMNREFFLFPAREIAVFEKKFA